MSKETLSTKVAEQGITIKYIMEQFTKSQEENIKQHETLLKSQNDFHAETRETLEKMGEKLDKALEKKAGIWVERVLYGAGAVAGVYGLNKLLGLLF